MIPGVVPLPGCGAGDGFHNGNIIDGAPLHVIDQSLPHLGGILPPVSRIGSAGFQQDPGHFLIGSIGGGQGLGQILGQSAVVEDLIKDHAQGVSISGTVQHGEIVQQLRGRITAAVFFRHGGIFHGVQGGKAQVADFIFLLVGNENVGWLQIDVHHPGLAAGSQRGTDIDAQVHRFQVGNRVAVHITLQGQPEAAEQANPVAGAVFLHGFHLAAFVGKESLQPGQILQQLNLPDQIAGGLAEIVSGLRRVFVGSGDQQCIQLGLGCGDGNHLNNIFSFGIFLHRGITANAIMVVYRCTDGKTIQQGRDVNLFRHVNSPPLSPVSYTKITKNAICLCLFS